MVVACGVPGGSGWHDLCLPLKPKSGAHFVMWSAPIEAVQSWKSRGDPDAVAAPCDADSDDSDDSSSGSSSEEENDAGGGGNGGGDKSGESGDGSESGSESESGSDDGSGSDDDAGGDGGDKDGSDESDADGDTSDTVGDDDDDEEEEEEKEEVKPSKKKKEKAKKQEKAGVAKDTANKRKHTGKGEAGEVPTKKQKKSKGNEPKKPQNAYQMYCKTVRSTLKEQNPELDFGALAKLCGQKWSDVPEEKKKPFKSRAAEDKARYEREKQEMIDQGTYVAPTKKGGEKEKKEKKPKGTTSAYSFFCIEQRPRLKTQHPNKSPKDYTKLLGESWKALSDAEKEPYKLKSDQDRIRAAADKKEFNQKKEREQQAETAAVVKNLSDGNVDAYCMDLRRRVRERLTDPHVTHAEMEGLIDVIVNEGSFELMRALNNYAQKPKNE